MVAWQDLRLMRPGALLLAGVLCAACASEPPAEGSTLTDGSTVYTFRCDDDWARCYAAAQKACGPTGYEEIDRAIDGSLSNAGRVRNRVFTDSGAENEVYNEDVRTEVNTRVITIRCTSK